MASGNPPGGMMWRGCRGLRCQSLASRGMKSPSSGHPGLVRGPHFGDPILGEWDLTKNSWEFEWFECIHQEESMKSIVFRWFPMVFGMDRYYLGMDQYLLIPFLGGWTSIYQLFWGSLGTRVLTHCHMTQSSVLAEQQLWTEVFGCGRQGALAASWSEFPGWLGFGTGGARRSLVGPPNFTRFAGRWEWCDWISERGSRNNHWSCETLVSYVSYWNNLPILI